MKDGELTSNVLKFCKNIIENRCHVTGHIGGRT